MKMSLFKDIVLGIDIGGTTCKCRVFATDGTLVYKDEIPTRKDDGGSLILSDIKETVKDKEFMTVLDMHAIVVKTLDKYNQHVANSYREYRNYKVDFVKMLDEVYNKAQKIMYLGDKENSNTDSALVTTKRSLVYNELNLSLIHI